MENNMKPTYTGIKKQTDNPFLNMYAMDAVDKNGKKFGYYFATRKKDGELACQTAETSADGAVIYAVTDDGSRIVLIKQYRYPLARYLYELPAGLIEPGESAAETAARELYEETGLEFREYTGGMQAFRRAFYQAQGLCDESNELVFGYASGDVSENNTEGSEDIETVLADRREALRILCEEEVSVRCAYMLTQFINADCREPFAFLSPEIGM